MISINQNQDNIKVLFTHNKKPKKNKSFKSPNVILKVKIPRWAVLEDFFISFVLNDTNKITGWV